MRSPRLVAESLRAVPEPAGTALSAARAISAAGFAHLLAGAWSPERSGARPPAFLRPHQVDPWRRAIATLAGWRGAVIAEPVGYGKTWIALGVAACWSGRCTVLGPAALAGQWRDAARRAGVALSWHSLERLSRGHLPPRASLVIVDEAHRLRHHQTRRVRLLAPWLVGRRTLLLTATPIVNRRRDLLAILSLVVADDALALDGIRSLTGLEACREPPPALRRLVIRSAGPEALHPAAWRPLRCRPAERDRADRIAATIDRLALSPDPAVRHLLASVLLDAGASSDAAWLSALGRYRALLLHSREAGGASRAALRRFVGSQLDQVVMWPMMGELDAIAAPPVEDLAEVEAALAAAARDEGWIGVLRTMLRDGRITACFCRHRATARALVRGLGDHVAWVTGAAAGIGPHRVPRHSVLATFGPARDRSTLRRCPPTVLVTTEVLAEGIDLQAASRVVHVDLPWHATRLEQRTGRVRRAGQQAPMVEIVHRPVPRALERRLGMHRRIRTKGQVAARWLAALVRDDAGSGDVAGGTWVAACDAEEGVAAHAWVTLVAGRRAGCIGLAIDHEASASAASAAPPSGLRPPTAAELRRGATIAAIAARHALGMVRAEPVGRAVLVARILRLARSCASRRDGTALERLDRLLALATAPGTRGLELLLDRLRDTDDERLLDVPLPRLPERGPVTVRWAAVILYRRPSDPLA